MKATEEKYVRVVNGERIGLGTEAEFRLAARDITEFTNGISLSGATSMLWEFLDGDRIRLSAERADLIAKEALEFKRLFGKNLSPRANKLLAVLASMSLTGCSPPTSGS